MNIKIDIHKNNQLEKKLKDVPKWKVPESTKKEIKEFINKAKIGQVQQGKRLSDRTLSKYLSLLKHSLEIINKQTSKIKKQDIEKFDKKITSEGLKSVNEFRVNLKIFLKWKLGEEKENNLSGWLDTRGKNKTPDYLSEGEITKLFKGCKNSNERYLISVLFDSGCRIEEFLNIRYEDIQIPDKSDYVKLTLKEEYSKTKGRTISLYWKYTLESVRDFLKEREQEGIKSDEQVYNTQTYDAIRMFLLRLGKRILKKDIYPHLFRHSSATFYASKLNRQELCYRYGWAFSSRMPDIYISRAGMESKELDEKFKSTELEELYKKIEQEKFEREKIQETLNNIQENNLLATIKVKESILNILKMISPPKTKKEKEMINQVIQEIQKN